MTAQVPDKYEYEGKEYSIIAMSDDIEFSPEQYGLEPQYICTACWRGYAVKYAIEDEKLLVKNLFVSDSSSGFPNINGIEAESIGDIIFSHMYRNINLQTEYTGKIVMGNGFIRDYYIHMGFQRAWAYEKVIELIFEKGVLVNVIDHSEKVKAIRAEIEAGTREAKEDSIPTFVDKSFSLAMEDKVWWIY